jgi:uncharacterized protein YjbJ (UPF0337 family)
LPVAVSYLGRVSTDLRGGSPIDTDHPILTIVRRQHQNHRTEGVLKMSAIDKIQNKAQDLVGQAKEKLGDVTGNEDLQAEGLADQAKADVKDAGEAVKDVFKN